MVLRGTAVANHRQQEPSRASMPVWKLGEAKAKLSQVVRLAAAGRPQQVTVSGRDAVVVVSTDEFDRLRAATAAPTLHELLSRSPLNRLEFEREPVHGPVRELDI